MLFATLDREGSTGCYLLFMGECRAVLVGTWWYWVRRRQYWLIHDGTGSVLGGTDWYLVVLGKYEAELVGTGTVEGSTGCTLVLMGQYRAVLVGTWWYWVRTGRYWLPA